MIRNLPSWIGLAILGGGFAYGWVLIISWLFEALSK